MEKRLTLAAAALALIAIGLLPVLAMVANTFYVAGEFSLTAYEALLASGKQLTLLMGRSVLLSVSVTFVAMVAGVPLGVLLGRTDLPLRGALTMLLTLPLLIPPYVIAVAWFAVLGSSGWIGGFLSPATSEFLSSTFFGLYGCIGALSTAFMPVAMLLTIAYVGDGESAVGTSRSIDEPLAPRANAHHSAIDRSGDSICGCVGLPSYAWRSRRSHLFALPCVPGGDPHSIRCILRF